MHKINSLHFLPFCYQRDVYALSVAGDLNEHALKLVPIQYAARLVIGIVVFGALAHDLTGWIGAFLSIPISVALINLDYYRDHKVFTKIYINGEPSKAEIIDRFVYWPSRVGYDCRIENTSKIIRIAPNGAFKNVKYKEGDRVSIYLDKLHHRGVPDEPNIKRKFCLKKSRV